jgi:glycosyltransferase involved in cell wall biosynthesis
MSTDARYLRGYDAIVEAFGVTNDPPALKVLIVTGDPIGKKLSGPGIRAWHMAEALSVSHDVTLVSLSGVDEALTSAFRLAHVDPGDNKTFSGWESFADVIIFQGHAMELFPSLRSSKKYRIADLYDPMHLEQLEQARHLPLEQWDQQVDDASRTIESQLALGDYFLCASERQRHFYLGQLTTLGRVTPLGYADDPHLERLLGVVPFGLPGVDPQQTRQVLKGVVPGIGKDDHVIIWSGGIYDWFDPLTLIRAVAQLAEKNPSVKLFFMGTAHPHPGVPEMPIIKASRELATELGVLGTHVFFNDSWVDYDDRQNYLLEADIGVSTHRSHIAKRISQAAALRPWLCCLS